MHLQIIEKSNCAEVEIKHGSTRYSVVIGNQFSCDHSSMQKPNGNTSYHIVWVLLNLMQVGEGNHLIAQVEIGHAALMEMLSKVPTEIPHYLPAIDNKDRNYDQILMQHPLLNRNQTWYLGHKPTGTPFRCSGCLRPRTVQSKDLHSYVQGVLFLPEEQNIVDTKLQFCLSARCTNGMTSSNNNIKPKSSSSLDWSVS